MKFAKLMDDTQAEPDKHSADLIFDLVKKCP